VTNALTSITPARAPPVSSFAPRNERKSENVKNEKANLSIPNKEKRNGIRTRTTLRPTE
jgi:hypothetical protein